MVWAFADSCGQLTDNEEDPNDLEAANSDDERFLEKKQIAIDQAKVRGQDCGMG